MALFGLFYTSCANVGMPSGGKKDRTPPVILKSTPAEGQLNVTDNKVRIYFDEFVQNEKLNEKFVISPPLSKRPNFRTKGKSMVVELNDTLQKNRTYSLDFKDGIVDYNERNPVRNYRLAFSTGNVFDSLRIVGFVHNAFNLEPMSGSYVALYSGSNDSLIFSQKPEYIAKTNEKGFFAVTNIHPASYQVYALGDVDNNLIYTPGVDSIAFLDSLIVPSAAFSALQDTAVTGMDTLVVSGKTRYYPDPVHLFRFEEEYFDLLLDKYERPKRNYIDLYFTESAADTFHIDLVNAKPDKPWYLMEKSRNMDTIRVWLTDSNIYKMDTLYLDLAYQQIDSLGKLYVKNDTIRFFFSDRKTDKTKRGDRRKVETVEQNFPLSVNSSSAFDIYRDLLIQSPEPIASFDTSMVHLAQKQDTLFVPVPFTIRPDSVSQLKYWVSHPWKFGSTYRITVDSAAVQTIYNLQNKLVNVEITLKEEEDYGKIIYNMTNVSQQTIFQLLSADAKETVVREAILNSDGDVVFQYLEPGKYLIKAIFDRNRNGKWDTGNLKERLQPEEVVYYPLVIKVRSNWDNENTWMMPGIQTEKKIVDEEAEAEKQKNSQKRNKQQ